ncbi:p24 complex component [Lunasporangiospora selenospora]|uniref:P24 complex component n=1 Tax=Lunasporangiospora selenospora TaxID=979761 RepID=A0A9P6FZB7_9FUNG|nr:p24 complex component [Lunasporangiospora selenospora]
MLGKLAILLATLLVTLQLTAAFNLVVPAQERRCFFEDLEKEDNIHVSFQVGEGGHLDIDFWVSDPNGIFVEDVKKSASASFLHVAKMNGKYEYCFSNVFSTITEKSVGFNFQAVRNSAWQNDEIYPLLCIPCLSHPADPLEKEIRELAAGIEEIRNEQEYTLARERTHRNTAESTNSRVVWWSLFQTGILFLICVFQITYLKRFFEVKRVV